MSKITNGFFDEQTENSRVKAKIVESYFTSWSRIMCNHWPGVIGYVDLYSGPGKYKDGRESVPLELVKRVLASRELSKRVMFLFNDNNISSIKNLKVEINNLPDSQAIKDHIVYSNRDVESRFSNGITFSPNVPVLSFVDPWGYKGLTLRLVDSLIENNGSDCIFFFNYNRITMALSQALFDEHLEGLFGKKMTSRLKIELDGLEPNQREDLILSALVSALNRDGLNHVLPFKFWRQDMQRTSHFVIFVTKHQLGFQIMKQIMYDIDIRSGM